jgi:DNA helicase-2/ATP-dependent DNA helicase PcrA
MTTLSTSQSRVVTAPIGGALQVLASAGSGKTRVLTERVRHIIENTQKDGVIAITFTNKAAEEMQARLEFIEGFEDRCWIATIHSLCQRIVEQYGHSIGLPADLQIYERDQDRKAVFLQSLRENGTDVDAFLNVSDERMKRDRERVIQNYLEQFSVVKRNLLTAEEATELYSSDESFWTIFKAYQDSLIQGGGMDFDDILVYAVRILLEQPWCAQVYRAKYKHVCVDEAQDLNKAQYEFIKAFCSDQIRSIMLVGDPNQMIYGFNGSTSEFLCQRFIADFSPSTFTLQENYRSSKRVIHLANKLKPGSQVESDFAKAGRSELQSFRDEEGEALWTCQKIRDLLESEVDPENEIEGKIGLNNIVVLARNRFVFHALEKALSDSGIAYALRKGERQAEPTSVFGRVLDLSIRLRLNSKDWVDGKKLCSTLKVQPPAAWGSSSLLAALAASAASSDIPFNSIQADLLAAVQLLDLDSPNIPKLCAEFSARIRELSARADLNATAELERSLFELQEFRVLWTTFRKKGLGESLAAFRNAIALGKLSDDGKEAGLTLSTVHTMKGLEKDIVFLIGMCEGVFPDYRATSPKELAEELNNAFVAVTRSRRWIYVSYPERRKMPWGDTKLQQPSRFFKMMQP